jgi:hypothetical protein
MTTLCIALKFVILAKIRVLQCFLSLLEWIKVSSLRKHNQSVILKMCDLAFLIHICGHLNDLNNGLQGKCQLVTELYNNVSAFQMKLSFHS